GRRSRDLGVITNYGLIAFPAVRETGRAVQFERATSLAVDRSLSDPLWRSGFMQVLVWADKLDDARAELDILAGQNFHDFPRESVARYALVACADGAAAVHDTQRAQILYEILKPAAGRGVEVGPAVYHGAVDRYLGLLASTLGRYDDAITHHS